MKSTPPFSPCQMASPEFSPHGVYSDAAAVGGIGRTAFNAEQEEQPQADSFEHVHVSRPSNLIAIWFRASFQSRIGMVHFRETIFTPR